MTDDAAFYARALGRMSRVSMALAVAGSALAFLLRGPAIGAGFLTGACLSLLNFRWWVRLVNAIGAESAKRPRRASAVFLGLRYLLAGLVVYVIVRVLEVSVAAVLAGLFVAVAAVIIEILYELIYARA